MASYEEIFNSIQSATGDVVYTDAGPAIRVSGQTVAFNPNTGHVDAVSLGGNSVIYTNNTATVNGTGNGLAVVAGAGGIPQFINSTAINTAVYGSDAADTIINSAYDSNFYRATNADLAHLNDEQLFDHFVTYGRNEGRLGDIPFFDAATYREANADVDAAFAPGDDAAVKAHYYVYGLNEGRNVGLNFDAQFYQETYSDIVGSPADALKHYIQFGQYEGRSPNEIGYVVDDANLHKQDAIIAGAGDDYIEGSGGVSDIRGGEGNDLIRGNGGDDILNGDNGHDRIEGGDGNDQIWGGLDNDALIDTSGINTINGGAGNDDITTNDLSSVFTGSGNDTVRLVSTGLSGDTGYITFEGDGGVVIENFSGDVQVWDNPDGLDTVLLTHDSGQQTQITAAGGSEFAENFALYGAGEALGSDGYAEAHDVQLTGLYVTTYEPEIF